MAKRKRNLTAAGIMKIENRLNLLAKAETFHFDHNQRESAHMAATEAMGVRNLNKSLAFKCHCAESGDELVKGKRCVCGTSHNVVMMRLRRLAERGRYLQ